MSIVELLNSMKENPEMFFEEKKIEYIHEFLGGYCYAGNRNGLPEGDINREFDFWFWKWFLRWIKEKMEPEYSPPSCCWADYIKDLAGGEEKEVSWFYELCEVFFEDYENKRGYFEWRK